MFGIDELEASDKEFRSHVVKAVISITDRIDSGKVLPEDMSATHRSVEHLKLILKQDPFVSLEESELQRFHDVLAETLEPIGYDDRRSINEIRIKVPVVEPVQCGACNSNVAKVKKVEKQLFYIGAVYYTEIHGPICGKCYDSLGFYDMYPGAC